MPSEVRLSFRWSKDTLSLRDQVSPGHLKHVNRSWGLLPGRRWPSQPGETTKIGRFSAVAHRRAHSSSRQWLPTLPDPAADLARGVRRTSLTYTHLRISVTRL